MDLLFSQVTAVTMFDRLPVIYGAYVGVTDGKISYISQDPPAESADRVIDGRGKVLMPGLINCHCHIAMTPLRGWGDDNNLQDWLTDWIFPKEDLWDARAIRCATLLGLAEAIRFGTTSITDMYMFPEEVCQCFAAVGLKGNIASSLQTWDEDYCFDEDEAAQALEQAYEAWNGYDNGRIRVEAGIHAEYTSNCRLWQSAAEFALDRNTGLMLHVAETKSEAEDCLEVYGLTQAELLDQYAVWAPRTLAVHSVWHSDEDLDLLARKQVTAVHCPASNLKLASGIAPVRKMLDKGINVALGTDGDSSSNTLDMFEAMRLAAFISNGSTLDPTSLSAQQALQLATLNGAKAQGREGECGAIAPGMDADLILLDFAQPHLIPCHNPVSNLVYAASGRDVVMTMVRGRILYENGTYTTIDLNAVLQEFRDYVLPKLFTPAEEEEEEAEHV